MQQDIINDDVISLICFLWIEDKVNNIELL